MPRKVSSRLGASAAPDPTFQSQSQSQPRTSDPVPQEVPPAVEGANITRLDVPSRGASGGSLRISGIVHYNNFNNPIINTPVRVRVESPDLQQDRVQTLGGMVHCNERIFAIDVPVRGEPGEEMSLIVKSQSKGAVWRTDETQGPFTVQITTQGAIQIDRAREFAPWVIGGGLVGAGASQVFDQPLALSSAGGAGVGLGAKLVSQEISGVDLSFPVVPVVATTALIASTAFLISEVTDANPFA